MTTKCSAALRISTILFLTVTFGAVNAEPSTTEPSAAEKRLAAFHQTFEDTGQSQNCINTRMIRDTTIIDKQHILFRLSHGQYAVNKLPAICHGLRKGRAFAYSPISTRLCSVDTITILDSHSLGHSSRGLRGGFRMGLGLVGPRCGLGQFSIMKKRIDAPAIQPTLAKELAEVVN